MHWYALHSKPNKESFLWRELAAQSVEVFYPHICVNPINPRSRKNRPFLPGYLFVHLEVEQAGSLAFRWMPCSYGLVSFGGEPASVPDELISAIRGQLRRVEIGGGVVPDLKPGDRVLIAEGPLAGYEAVFDRRLSDRERVRVLLNLIERRHVRVDLGAGQIQKKRP